MKYLPLMLSIVLHAATTAFLVYGPPILHLGARPPEVYEVFLVEQAVTPLPPSAPLVKVEPQMTPKTQKKPVQSKKRPKPQPKRQAVSKPPSTVHPPLQTPPTPALPTAPVIEPGVAAISHVKTAMAPANATQPNYSASFTYDNNTLYLGNDVILQDGKPRRDTLKQGSELRFALRRLAHDDFSREDFAGHYTVSDDRFMSILDLREVFGDYVLYDSRTGLFRLLHKTGEMIYAYGPEFADEETVEGSVTFFPVKHKELYQDSEKPGHAMWLPKEPMMQWGTRIRMVEENVTVGAIKHLLVRLPSDTPLPAVVWIYDRGLPMALVRGFAQALAVHGVAVLALAPGPGPRDGTKAPVDVSTLAANALAALRQLALRKDVDAAHMGLLGINSAGQAVVQALASPDQKAAFGVVLNTRADSSGSLAPAAWPQTDGLRVPLHLACVSAFPPSHWQGQRDALLGVHALRGIPLSLEILPAGASGAIQLTGKELSHLEWLPDISPHHASALASWIIEQ